MGTESNAAKVDPWVQICQQKIRRETPVPRRAPAGCADVRRNKCRQYQCSGVKCKAVLLLSSALQPFKGITAAESEVKHFTDITLKTHGKLGYLGDH